MEPASLKDNGGKKIKIFEKNQGIKGKGARLRRDMWRGYTFVRGVETPNKEKTSPATSYNEVRKREGESLGKNRGERNREQRT